jgi:hypothetical protein
MRALVADSRRLQLVAKWSLVSKRARRHRKFRQKAMPQSRHLERNSYFLFQCRRSNSSARSPVKKYSLASGYDPLLYDPGKRLYAIPLLRQISGSGYISERQRRR